MNGKISWLFFCILFHFTTLPRKDIRLDYGNITLTCGAVFSPFSNPDVGDNNTTTMDCYY